MFVAHYERTMRHAKPVHDAGICLRRPVLVAALPAPPTQEVHPEPIEFPVILSHPRRLIAQVAAWHELTSEDILGPSRRHPIVLARRDAIAAIALNCRIDGRRYSLPEIARSMRNRDHTTILFALRRAGIDRRYEAGK